MLTYLPRGRTPAPPSFGQPLALLGLALVGVVFALDLLTARGYAVGMFYVIPVLLGLWAPTHRYTIGVGLAAALLILIGYVASPGALTAPVVLNRAGAILAVSVTAWGVLLQRRTQAALRASEQQHRDALAQVLEAEQTRRALVAQLEAKNAELERFTYTVSHDLKSPLITIKGFLGSLESDAVAGNFERLRADIQRIARAADRMKQLLDDVLELSRVGRIANPSEPVHLGELAQEVVQTLAGTLRDVSVDIRVPVDLPPVLGDRTRLGEVLQNLIENAIKFRGDQAAPHIEVGARDEGDHLVCYVQDNGMGLDPRYHERVFHLFEQLGSDGEGSGVGLALARRIVEVHEGRIWVESDGLGKGSTFYVTLPTAGPPAGLHEATP